MYESPTINYLSVNMSALYPFLKSSKIAMVIFSLKFHTTISPSASTRKTVPLLPLPPSWSPYLQSLPYNRTHKLSLCKIATANASLFTEIFSQYTNISNALRIYSRYIAYYTPELMRIFIYIVFVWIQSFCLVLLFCFCFVFSDSNLSYDITL